MAHHEFGNTDTISAAIRNALKVAPTLCSTDTQLLLRDRYETVYGIYNHEDPYGNRSLPLVGMHWAEDTVTGCSLYEMIDMYVNHDIMKHFGLSLTDFLDLPTYVVTHLFETAAKLQKSPNRAVQDLLNEMNK